MFTKFRNDYETVDKLDVILLKNICKKLVKQDYHHKARITAYYRIMREAAEKEFTEDNEPTLNAFLEECFTNKKPMLECTNIGGEKQKPKIQFRKVRRFTGTKKYAVSAVFLQYKEESQPWIDVLDITRTLDIRDGCENYPWQDESEEKKYKKALHREQLNDFR